MMKLWKQIGVSFGGEDEQTLNSFIRMEKRDTQESEKSNSGGNLLEHSWPRIVSYIRNDT